MGCFFLLVKRPRAREDGSSQSSVPVYKNERRTSWGLRFRAPIPAPSCFRASAHPHLPHRASAFPRGRARAIALLRICASARPRPPHRAHRYFPIFPNNRRFVTVELLVCDPHEMRLLHKACSEPYRHDPLLPRAASRPSKRYTTAVFWKNPEIAERSVVGRPSGEQATRIEQGTDQRASTSKESSSTKEQDTGQRTSTGKGAGNTKKQGRWPKNMRCGNEKGHWDAPVACCLWWSLQDLNL